MEKAMQDFRDRPQGTLPNIGEMRQRFEDVQTKIVSAWNPEQQTKARELSFQLAGGLDSRVMNERTLETLDLTADQKEKFRKILTDRDAEFSRVMQNFDWRNATPEEREKMRSDAETRTKRYADLIKALLTPEQKAKAEKLTAAAPELREKLGIPAPGQRGQGGRAQGQQPGQPYVPGAGAWRPGQGAPDTGDTPPQRTRQRSGFGRGGNSGESSGESNGESN
jgi:Spy/CpxP family protein refolding chaperone